MMHRKIQIALLVGLLLAGCAPQQTNSAALANQPPCVTILLCGQATRYVSEGETVEALLQRLDIPLVGGYRASLPLDAITYDGMLLRVDLYESRMEVHSFPVVFDTCFCDDPSLPAGVEEELFPGVEGRMDGVFSVDCMNGNARGYELQAQRVTAQPKSRIVAVGTGEKVGQERVWPLYGENTIVLEDGQVLTYTHAEQFSATAYTAWVADTTGTTATGTQTRVGAIAVDPRVIPYGTKMFIVTNDGEYVYGIATAEDCGGAIKGNKVDLFFDTLEECYAFGRRSCTIYFLE